MKTIQLIELIPMIGLLAAALGQSFKVHQHITVNKYALLAPDHFQYKPVPMIEYMTAAIAWSFLIGLVFAKMLGLHYG